MATATTANGIFNQKVIGEIVRLNLCSSFKMLRDLDDVFSPISVTYIQAMARAVAQDEQLKIKIMDIQMFKELEFAMNENFFHLGMADMLNPLNTEGLRSNLSVKNNIFYKKSSPVTEKYLTFWETFYGSRYTPLKRHKNDAGTTYNDVNRWISEQSGGTITDVITESNFDKCADFLLVNCVFFSGQWDVSPNFNVNSTKYTSVRNPRVFISKIFECKFLELKYAGNRFSMIFIFPDNLAAYRRLCNKLQLDGFHLIMERCWIPSPMDFVLPHGGFQWKTRLQNVMPLKTCNDTSGTRFVTQKVFLEITEMGTKAAAVTVLNQSVPETTDEEITQVLTKQTIFVLYDTIKKVVVFMGAN